MHSNHQEPLSDQRAALNKLIVSMKPEFFVTLNSNRSMTPAGYRGRLKDFFARMDRHLLGRKWSSVPSEDRTVAIVFLENFDSNLHAHLLLRTPSSSFVTTEELRIIVDKYWTELVASGSSWTEAVYNAAGVASYVTKQTHRRDNYDSFFLSTEFHR